MPYIAYNDRAKFRNTITSVLSTILEGPDALYVKGEYFGYFVNRMVRKFEGSADFTSPAFNSTFFNQSKQKTLANCADSAAVLVNKADPLAAAGEINYIISAIYWGFLGKSDLTMPNGFLNIFQEKFGEGFTVSDDQEDLWQERQA